jgi:hypothetical protein
MERKIERRIGGLLDRVPGYRGYRAKEDRRDADRRVREHVAAAFAAQGDRVERVAADLANRRRLDEIGPVDALARDLRHLVDRIGTATYGYGGLWSDRDVDDAALDQLRQFDEGLLSGVEELDQPLADLEAALAAGGDLSAPTRAAADVVRAVHARFDLRHEVVETGKPAPEDRVLAVLEPPRPETPPPAYNLHERDAVAILGDNFLVDARIEVESEARSFRLFRLGGGEGERWLFVPKQAGERFALLSPVAGEETTSGEQTTFAGTAYTTQSVGSGDGEAIGAGGESGRRPVRFRLLQGAEDPSARAVVLDWQAERQVLTGKEVFPDDVEVFGPSTA